MKCVNVWKMVQGNFRMLLTVRDPLTGLRLRNKVDCLCTDHRSNH